MVKDQVTDCWVFSKDSFSALRVHFEGLFAVKAQGNTPAHSLHLFMNHRDVISVYRFVQQLQNLIESLMGAPAENPQLKKKKLFCLGFSVLLFFSAIGQWASSLCKVYLY